MALAQEIETDLIKAIDLAREIRSAKSDQECMYRWNEQAGLVNNALQKAVELEGLTPSEETAPTAANFQGHIINAISLAVSSFLQGALEVNGRVGPEFVPVGDGKYKMKR